MDNSEKRCDCLQLKKGNFFPVMRYYLFLYILLLFSIASIAQQPYSAKASQWQAEGLGPAGLFSINFDSRFSGKEAGLGFRIGLGGAPLGLLGESCNSGIQITLPGGLNYLIGKRNHFFELGAGGVLAISGGTKRYCVDFKSGFFSEDATSYGFVSAGYRFQPYHTKGLTYRIFVSPLFQKHFSPKAWGGAGIGYRF